MASQPATRTHRSPTLQPQQLRASMPFHSWKRWRWRLSPCPRHTLQDITRFYTITCFRRLLGWHKRSLSAQLPTTVRNTAANRQTGLAQLALFPPLSFSFFFLTPPKKKKIVPMSQRSCLPGGAPHAHGSLRSPSTVQRARCARPGQRRPRCACRVGTIETASPPPWILLLCLVDLNGPHGLASLAWSTHGLASLAPATTGSLRSHATLRESTKGC